MTLSNLVDIVSIVSSLSMAFIAVWIFVWTRKSEENNQLRQSTNEMQTYNLAILQDDKLLKMEAKNHPYGELQLDEARKMYQYFLWINIADNMRKAASKGLLNASHSDVRFQNQARIAYPDRAFLEEHVFPRGYETGLIKAFRECWKAIEECP